MAKSKSKPIAVLGARLDGIHNWIMDNFNIQTVIKNNRRYFDNTNQEFLAVTSLEHARGMEFSAVLVSTSTGIDWELIDYCQSRIR